MSETKTQPKNFAEIKKIEKIVKVHSAKLTKALEQAVSEYEVLRLLHEPVNFNSATYKPLLTALGLTIKRK